MSESLRLGRIAGVTVGINWSVLVIFLLVAVMLAGGRLPLVSPGLDVWVYAVAGFAAAVVFFVSLLAHELAHAVVARRNGVDVEGITLWLFGGVARLAGEPASPGADFRIAAVGPMVSLVLGVVFLAAGAAAGFRDSPQILAAVLVWLGAINIALALFNLVPAAPLDGGRILRAALWHWRKDRTAAAVLAARAGRIFGLVLVALGLLEFAAGAGLPGLWLVLIGWFLTGAASMEQRHAQLRGALGDLRVADVMTPHPTVAPDDLSVEDFLNEYVLKHRYSTFPLVRNGQTAGLVTMRRLRDLPSQRRAQIALREIACPPEELAIARPDELLVDVLPRMTGCPDGRVLVMDDGDLLGIVSPTDVNHVLEVAQLRPRPERQLH